MRRWLGTPYDPNAFDPAKVHFDNPQKRWDFAFRYRNPEGAAGKK